MSLEFFSHAHSIFEVSELIMFSSLLMLDKLDTSGFLIREETSLMNEVSSSLFFAIENLVELIFSSIMGMVTMSEA